MANYYFTFGCGHPTYPDIVARVTVDREPGPEAYEEARTRFMERFGTSWSMQYGEDEFCGFITKYPNYRVTDYEELVPVECDLY